VSEVLELVEEAFDAVEQLATISSCGIWIFQLLLAEIGRYWKSGDTEDRVHGGQQLALWNALYAY
jgi:hypothetical protein